MGKLTIALTSRPELVRELLASELVYVPAKATSSEEQIECKVANLVETLEEHEDTLRVYTTLDPGAN
jgi:transcriptional/translational regulatory protein YebC/TACO1